MIVFEIAGAAFVLLALGAMMSADTRMLAR